MRLLNKLSTGAHRFKATPVEAVRLGVAHIKGPAVLQCIGPLPPMPVYLWVTWHQTVCQPLSHLHCVSKQPGKAMHTGDAPIIRACRSTSAELPTLPLPQRQVAFEVSTSIIEETSSARGPSLAHAQYFQREDRCVPPSAVVRHLLTAMPCMHHCKQLPDGTIFASICTDHPHCCRLRKALALRGDRSHRLLDAPTTADGISCSLSPVQYPAMRAPAVSQSLEPPCLYAADEQADGARSATAEMFAKAAKIAKGVFEDTSAPQPEGENVSD